MRKDFIIFFTLIIIVVFLQYLLLYKQLQYGFMPDDWWPLFEYKTAGMEPLSAFKHIWERNGIYTTYQIYYIGILYDFFNLDFFKYQLVNQLLKVISVLSIYPLILKVFRSRILAFLSVLIYAIHFSPVGTLEITAKGSDYIGITLMSFFLLSYAQVVTNSSWKKLVVTLLLLILTFALSPIRTYPIIPLIFLVELFLMAKNKFLLSSLQVKRLIFIFLPLLLVLIHNPLTFTRFMLINPPAIIERISYGNWQMLLHPVISYSSIFIEGDVWQIFGRMIISSGFKNYLLHLISSTEILFFLAAVFFAYIVSKKPFGFIIKLISLTLVSHAGVYFLVTHQNNIPQNLKVHFDGGYMPLVLVGLFILNLVFLTWVEWLGRKKDYILLALWLAPFFSFVFIWFTWVLSDYVVVFRGVHSYLNIPAMGSSVFLAAVSVAIFNKLKNKSRAVLLIFPILFFSYFIMSSLVIDKYVTGFLNTGMRASEQQQFREQVWSVLKNSGYDGNKPALIYFDAGNDYVNGRFYEISTLARFDKWLYFWSSPKDICMLPQNINSDRKKLENAIVTKYSGKGFLFPDICNRERFYSLEDFFAFRLSDKKVIDIKYEIVRSLKLTK